MDGATISTIRINGGRLALDFINTATWADGSPQRDFLGSFADVLTWGAREGLLGDAEHVRLTTLGPEAEAAMAGAKALRGALRHIFEPGRSAQRADAAMNLINERLAKVAPSFALESVGERMRIAAAPVLDGWLTAPLLVSALDLATTPAREQVRMCPGDDCHWLFLDQSRNGTRRWCSMESCGNRAKTRAHYLAHRASGGP